MKINVVLALTITSASLGILTPASTSAATKDHALIECSKIEDPATRVACYDNIVRDMQTVDQPNRVAAKEKKFGLTKPPPEAEPDLKILAVQITDVDRNPLGQLILTLDNGQVWRQVDQTRLSLKAGDRIAIKAGFGNAYYLSKNGSRRVKVRRAR